MGWRAQAMAAWAARRVPGASGYSMMAVADVDGDGKPDLLTDRYIGVGGGLSVLRNLTPDLARLQPSSGTLSPAFSGDTLDYELSLPYGGPDVRLTPWLAFGNARLSLTARCSPAAAPRRRWPARRRPRAVAIEVQSRDGSMRRYTVTLRRALARTETRLSALVPSVGARCSRLRSRHLSYTLALAAGSDSIRLRPRCSTAAPLSGSMGRRWRRTASRPVAWPGPQPDHGAGHGRGGEPNVRAQRAAAGPRQPGQHGAGRRHHWRRASAAAVRAAALPAASSWVSRAWPRSARAGCIFRTRCSTSACRIATPVPRCSSASATAPLPPGTRYWKWGPTPDQATPHWYEMPATISGDTVRFSITDGGLGDDDFALGPNGTVIDAGGWACPPAPSRRRCRRSRPRPWAPWPRAWACWPRSVCGARARR
jgi:hypothetical protein